MTSAQVSEEGDVKAFTMIERARHQTSSMQGVQKSMFYTISHLMGVAVALVARNDEFVS